ncbi:MAG: Polyketide cyclase / dehydrase and lipid transport [Thermoplasmata archaeon]|jgi:uncharacterized protein YndB with AHSA1/START domain|nr:Polyketide cyclase / dehydrase and lipid transport [Thermoplasmata archaeon]
MHFPRAARAVTHVERHGLVRAPPAAVYALITDFDASKTWLSGVTDSRLDTPGPVKAGTRFTQKRTTMGKASDVVGTVTKAEAPRLLVLDIRRDGKPAGVATWTLTPEGPGTRVSCAIDFQLPGLMKLFSPLVKGAIAKQTAGDIEAIDKKLATKP